MKTIPELSIDLQNTIQLIISSDDVYYNQIDKQIKQYHKDVMTHAHIKSLEGKLDFERVTIDIIRVKLVNNFNIDFQIRVCTDMSEWTPMQGSINTLVRQKLAIELEEFGAIENDQQFEHLSSYKSENGLLKTIKAEINKIKIQAEKGNIDLNYKYYLATYRGQEWNWQEEKRFTLWKLYKYNPEKNQSWNYFSEKPFLIGMSRDYTEYKETATKHVQNEWNDIQDHPPAHYKSYKDFLKANNINIDDVKR